MAKKFHETTIWTSCCRRFGKRWCCRKEFDISAVTGCGTAITAENVDTVAKMAGYVIIVLPERAESWIFRDIHFGSDRAELMPNSFPILETIVKILSDNPAALMNFRLQPYWI